LALLGNEKQRKKTFTEFTEDAESTELKKSCALFTGACFGGRLGSVSVDDSE
jgi:hypothetical protein